MPLRPPLRVALDLDGVFADFNTRFAELLYELTGKPYPRPFEPTVWDWPQALGYTDAEIDQAWQTVKDSPVWWTELPAYPNAVTALAQINLLIAQQRAQVAWVTSRPGANAHWQSVWWLAERGIEHPQVVVAESPRQKALALQALGSQVFVDDRPENVRAACGLVGHVWLKRRPWNAPDPHGADRVIESLPQLVTELRRRAG